MCATRQTFSRGCCGKKGTTKYIYPLTIPLFQPVNTNFEAQNSANNSILYFTVFHQSSYNNNKQNPEKKTIITMRSKATKKPQTLAAYCFDTFWNPLK